MLRSMFSAISGLRAHQTKLDVAGNNIANVNTVGFKGSQTVFEDTLSQIMRNGSSPQGDVAGTNPAQVGLGVKVAGITTNFGQGSTQNTGRASDFMISGDGFFVTKVGNENLFTRAGSFDLDGVGNLVTPDGAILQGWTAEADGTVDVNKPISGLKIPSGQVLAPVATTGTAVGGNLSASATNASGPVTSQISMYDDLGNAHAVSVAFTKVDPVAPATTSNRWSLSFTDTTTTPPTPLGTTDVDFNADGTPATTTYTIEAPTATIPAWTEDVVVDLTKLTQYGSKSDATVKTTKDSGSAMGVLQGYSLSGDGTIVGSYSNGLKQSLGKLALATFTNPGGLEKAGNSSYRAGGNAGNPLIGAAGTGGRGSLSAGALEMSNVALAEGFTGLMVPHRGFRATGRGFTPPDETLQGLAWLRR